MESTKTGLLSASSEWDLPPNVLPFFQKQSRYLFYLCNESSPQEQWGTFMPNHQLCSFESEEELRTALVVAAPQLILVRSDLNWTDPLGVIRELSPRFSCPIVLVMAKKKSKKQESFIRLAYQAGIFDLLFLPLKQDEVRETLEVLLKWSARA